jgi:hypothetical protein
MEAEPADHVSSMLSPLFAPISSGVFISNSILKARSECLCGTVYIAQRATFTRRFPCLQSPNVNFVSFDLLVRHPLFQSCKFDGSLIEMCRQLYTESSVAASE